MNCEGAWDDLKAWLQVQASEGYICLPVLMVKRKMNELEDTWDPS